MPLAHMNALKPDDATGGELVHRARHRPGRGRPTAPSRRARCAPGSARFSSNAAAVTVGGWALSGISIAAVAPPAASAARAGLEALPIGAAGLVEVHVRVDHPGQEMQAGGVDLLASRVPRARRPSAAISPSATPMSSRRCAPAPTTVAPRTRTSKLIRRARGTAPSRRLPRRRPRSSRTRPGCG